MRLEHERYNGLGTDALGSVCAWNMNVIMVWARMLERCKNPGVLQISTLQAHWHGCSGDRMLLEHERCYGLGMDALVSVCSWNTNVIMVWAWMLW